MPDTPVRRNGKQELVMSLPTQVQAALDAADATLAAANAAPDAGEQDAQASAPDPFMQPQLAQKPATAEPPAPESAKLIPQDDYQQRFKTLQGLFNEKVPALQHQVKELQTNLSEAVNRLNRASEVQERPPEPVFTPETKDVENFGEDLVSMVSRVAEGIISQAARAFEARVSALDEKIARLSVSVQGTTQAVAQTAEQSFFERVGKLVPAWEQINANPAFLAWLAESDPVYGVPRQVALDNAQQALNADRVAAVFSAFAPATQTPAAVVDPLDAQISPRSVASPAPVTTDRTVITQAQVTAFYDSVRRGEYRGNQAEVTRLEGIINTALAEGRVR